MIGDDAIVEPEKQTLDLRDDHVLVVAWIADQSTGDFGTVTRQVGGVGIGASCDRVTEEKQVRSVVQVRLVIGTAAVDVVEIQCRRSKVREGVGVVLLLKTARRVEGDIVIDELPEVRVERRYSALLVVRPVFGRIEIR